MEEAVDYLKEKGFKRIQGMNLFQNEKLIVNIMSYPSVSIIRNNEAKEGQERVFVGKIKSNSDLRVIIEAICA